MKKYFILILMALPILTYAQQLSLPYLFSNDMILQRNQEVKIWGNASPSHQITVLLNNETYSSITDKNGAWKVQLIPHSAGGDYTLKITDNSNQESITFTNLTFGDIWFCGGQSNMEWFVENSKNGIEEVINADFPDIRLLTIPRKVSNKPLKNTEKTKWLVCNPKTVGQFSAVGYFFGRKIHKDINIPIGLINNNWGGTVAEAWMSPESLLDLPKYKKQLDELADLDLKKAAKSGDEDFNNWLSKFETEDKGKKGDDFLWQKLEDFSSWKTIEIPNLWEGTDLENMKTLDGVVWLQKSVKLTKSQAINIDHISMGPIDDSDKTWINGVLVGETYNRYDKDRVYEIKPNILREGLNNIVVRVEDYVGMGGLYGEPHKYHLKNGKKNISISGTWKIKTGYHSPIPMPSNAFGPNSYPSMLFNGMISPMLDYAIKGAIWYQGESNVGRADEYKTLFRKLILDWRKQFKNPDLSFFFVQLANFGKELDIPKDSPWAELREAQASVLDLPNTGMITAIDIGEAGNIHPTNKQDVGKRLALAAQNIVYKKDLIYKGPTFVKATKKEDYFVVEFDTKLVTTDKHVYVSGFSLAEKEGDFYWAKAEIIGGNKLKVWSSQVSNPSKIRYGWADNPQPLNLYGKHGFPTFPFRFQLNSRL